LGKNWKYVDGLFSIIPVIILPYLCLLDLSPLSLCSPQVRTLELDAPLLDCARPYDLASLLDPPNGTCTLRELVIASGGVPGPYGGPSGAATSATPAAGMNSTDGSGGAGLSPGSPLPGSVAAYYTASKDAELNGPLLSSRRRSSFNSSSSAAANGAPSSGRFGTGAGDATPRDAAGSLAVLLGSLRANKSLQHLHLCLRPSDIDVEGALDEYAAAAAANSNGSNGSGSGNGGGNIRASQGRSADYRSQQDNGSATSAEASFRGVGAIPGWVTALGDCLAFNNTLESLLVRGDGARLAQACPALSDALATVCGYRYA